MPVLTVANAEKDNSGATRTSPVSAAVATSPPSTSVVAVSMVLVILAAVVMWLAYRYWIKPNQIHFSAGYVPYAGIIAAAAGLERFLEPLSKVLLSTHTKKEAAASSKSAALKAAADPANEAAAVQALVADAATKQADVNQRKTERAIIFWAIASTAGLVISGSFGFFLLQSVATSHVNTFLDLTITGLTIGAGTKPTHDLVTSIQAKAAGSS
jgi:uncharacterized membrane protein YdbT with pleckstrin-like domain